MKRSVLKDFAVISGQSTLSFEMHAIPTGTVMFSGNAYAESCASVTLTTVPAWMADDVSMTINPGPPAAVQLNFRANGNATVQGNFVPDSFSVTTLAGLATVPGSLDLAGAAARFAGPGALAFDGSTDALYVADRTSTAGTFSGMTIRRVTVSTGAVTTLAGSAAGVGTANGDGTTARFTLLNAVALSPSGGTLYIADRCALRAMTTSPPYTVTTLLGTADAQTWTCSPGVDSILDIAVRGTDLYIADQARAVISKISVAGASPTVSLVAGSAGTFGATDGPLTSAAFLGPQAIGFPSTTDDTFFVADRGTLDGTSFFGLVRRVAQSANSVTTIAGAEQITSGMIDGLRLNAFLALPRRIATDGSSLFITDLNAIRRLDLATGAVVTIAGSSTAGSGDGVGAAAGFASASGIARNAATRALYVADTGNLTIRILTP